KAAAIDLIHARAVRWMCHIPTCTISGGGAEASHALNSDREGRTRGECDFRKEMEAEDAEKRISASWVAELRHRLHVAAIRHELSGDGVDVERQRLVAWGRGLDVVPARHQIERRADAVEVAHLSDVLAVNIHVRVHGRNLERDSTVRRRRRRD